jgi:hypothetical protein
MKKMIPLLLSVVLFASCNAISARNYNNMIVDKETALMPQIKATEESVGAFIKEAKFDSMAAVSTRMESAVEKAIADIKSASAPEAKGAEEFKRASLEYFRFIKGIYTGYKKIALAKTDEERAEEYKNVQQLSLRRGAVVEKMQTVQKRFATDNNFSMDRN